MRCTRKLVSWSGIAAALLTAATAVLAADLENIYPYSEQGVFGSKEVQVQGNGVIDQMGGGQTVVRSNKLVKLKDSALVDGDAVCTGDIQVVGDAVLTGDASEGAPSLNLPVLKALIQNMEDNNDNAEIGLTSLGTNPLAGDKFSMEGAEQITLHTGDYYFSELEMKGDAVLRVKGTVTIYLDGPMDIRGNAQFNPGGECFLFVMSAAEQGKPMRVREHGKAWGAFYGMATRFEVQGDAEAFGAVAAERVLVKGKGKLHVQPGIMKTLYFPVPTETGDPEKVFGG